MKYCIMRRNPQPSFYMTIPRAARTLGRSRAWVEDRIRAGDLPVYRDHNTGWRRVRWTEALACMEGTRIDATAADLEWLDKARQHE